MIRTVLIGALLLATACDPEYGELRISDRAGELHQGAVSTGGLTIREGSVLIVFAEPLSASDAHGYDGLERFELESADPEVAMVRRGVLRDSFFVTGTRAGETWINVIVDGRGKDEYPVLVIEEDGQ